MTVTAANLRLAVRNIATHGDTDVFPFPLENHWFHDAEQEVVRLLAAIDTEFAKWIQSQPIISVKSLASVGYMGFRAATQIDPLWNAYLLGLVLQIAPDIEEARIPAADEVVFSYRFSPSIERNTLFDREIGWSRFHQKALDRSIAFPYVVSTDISDYYGRIPHHRLENALGDAVRPRSNNMEAVSRIDQILRILAERASYGLPIGGNAARMLAEIQLDRTDRLLRAQRITYMRFVDDYILFAQSLEDAHRALVRLSEALLREGLTLSRAKTRITTQSEFVKASPFAPTAVAESSAEAVTREFLGIRLHYDRYSPTAIDDYENLKQELERFDLPAMLAEELRKSRIDEMVTRQLVKAIPLLRDDIRDAAVLSLLENLHVLYPIFPSVAILLRTLLPALGPAVREQVFAKLRDRILENSHIFQVPANLSYAVRLLAHDATPSSETILNTIHDNAGNNMMLRRDVILAMTCHRAGYWLTMQLPRFSIATPWERKAILASSYVLGDEGSHWRDQARKQLNDEERAFLEWLSQKNNGRAWLPPV